MKHIHIYRWRGGSFDRHWRVNKWCDSSKGTSGLVTFETLEEGEAWVASRKHEGIDEMLVPFETYETSLLVLNGTHVDDSVRCTD